MYAVEVFFSGWFWTDITKSSFAFFAAQGIIPGWSNENGILIGLAHFRKVWKPN